MEKEVEEDNQRRVVGRPTQRWRSKRWKTRRLEMEPRGRRDASCWEILEGRGMEVVASELKKKKQINWSKLKGKY